MAERIARGSAQLLLNAGDHTHNARRLS